MRPIRIAPILRDLGWPLIPKLALVFFEGISTPVTAVSAGVIIAYASQTPREGMPTAVVNLAIGALVSLVIINAASTSLNNYLTDVLAGRLSIAVNRRVLEIISDPVEIHHLETPKTIDYLHAASDGARNTTRIVDIMTALGSLGTMLIGSSVVVAGSVWWMPLPVITVFTLLAIRSKRESLDRVESRLENTHHLRVAAYYLELAWKRSVAAESRIFGIRSWLTNRQIYNWNRGIRYLLRDIRAETVGDIIPSVTALFVAMISIVWIGMQSHGGGIGVGRAVTTIMAFLGMIEALLVLQQYPALVRRSADFLVALRKAELEVELRRSSRPTQVFQKSSYKPGPLQQGITFEDVSFKYPNGDRDIVRHFDLFIPAGATVAILGENGSGKSTLVKLLCRLYSPDHGRILFDGMDVSELDIHQYRRSIVPIFQDFGRLPGTLRENVTYGLSETEQHDDELLDQVIDLAGISDLIASLPKGWDTVLAARHGGIELSGGQWQQIALARAVYAKLIRDPAVMLIDEPTAALDLRAEAALNSRWTAVTGDTTAILISHRFRTIRSADFVAVMTNGSITQFGTFEDLDKDDGKFSEWRRANQSAKRT